MVRRADSGARLGFEETLWQASDKLRGSIDPSQYKYVLLGLLFLKSISDASEDHKNPSTTTQWNSIDQTGDTTANGFRVPPGARWSFLRQNARMPGIASLVDQAMEAIESENPALKGVLPKNYSASELDSSRLGAVIELLSTLGLGDEQSQSRDLLGRVYEYFLGRFASAESKGGEFYTPQSVVRLLVEMIEPLKGTVYDPCCGSGGMFVQSEKFVLAHGGRRDDLSVFGQESNASTWRLARMNLAVRGIRADLGSRNDDTLHNDLHSGLEADYILANPPFNDSDWGGERLKANGRWKHGIPPLGNANYAWVQHFVSHLAPSGIAGFVLANGALSSNQPSEFNIRRSLIESDLVDCVVYLPPQLFYTTQISASLWFLNRLKQRHELSDRRNETLMIYAYNMGEMVDRVHRQLSEAEVERISTAYRRWKGSDRTEPYRDIAGFCRSVMIQELRSHRYALVPGRYVGFDQCASDAESSFDFSDYLDTIRTRFEMFQGASEAALSHLEGLSNG